MKKLILSVFSSVMLIAVCFLCACVPTAVKIELSAQSITVECGKTAEFTYTVTPEGREVTVEVSDSKIAKYADGKITGVTVGTATVKVYEKGNDEVYEECTVAVAPPSGYKAYSKSDYKLVYPQNWQFKSQPTLNLVMFSSPAGNASINVVRESINYRYWEMTPAQFQSIMETQYRTLGYSAEFKSVTVEEKRYLGISRVCMTAEYTLLGQDIYQEQVIQNAGNWTYALTMTAPKSDGAFFKTVSEQFITF